MKRGTVLFLDTVHPVLQKELERNGFNCEDGREWSRSEIKDSIARYDGIVIRSRIKLDREVLSKANNLKFIARSGAGMENIDVKYAASRGIYCLHAPEANRDAVAEHTMGMLLALLNNIIRADKEVRLGIWHREENRGTELGGKTVGIIGYGNTGSAFAKRLQGFDVEVLAYDKYKSGFSKAGVREAALPEIFSKTDILSLHVPLTSETEYLVNDDFIRKFKKPFYLINTSRGKVVKTDDLVQAIEVEKVLGACLDVLEYESISFENINENNIPTAFRYLKESEKVVLSPHIAGWSYESYEKLSKVLAEKILRFYSDNWSDSF